MTTDSDAETPKARVRRILIDRLKDAGVKRPKAMKIADLDGLYDRLVADLAYMGEQNLETLVDEVLEIASARGGVLPPEIVIRQMARALEAKPFTEKRLVTSWLASVEGPAALKAGHAVELYQFLQRSPRPPLKGDMRAIREKAVANARRLELVRDRVHRCVASDDDGQWFDYYTTLQVKVRAIIETGRVVA